MKHTLLLLLVLPLFVLTGCFQYNLEEQRYNPFNDLRPYDVFDNALGFYARGVEYWQEGTMGLRVSGHQQAACIVHEPIDSMFICSIVFPQPSSRFYSNEDNYFTYISFLLYPDDLKSDGPVQLDGSQVALCDINRKVYEIVSATVLLDQQTTDGFSSGSFTVDYIDIDNTVNKITGGRFKLLHQIWSISLSFEFSHRPSRYGDENN